LQALRVSDGFRPRRAAYNAAMLRIGHLTFDFPVVQAALSGYSDGPMRLIARRLGAPYCVHEVVLDKSVAESAKARRRLLGTLAAEDHPVGGQLMGAEPEHFSLAAAEMAKHGYDVVDINFGCPVRKVLGRCRGGYLLSTPDEAIEIVRRVRAAVPPAIPVTLKMRLGWDDANLTAPDLARALADVGVAVTGIAGPDGGTAKKPVGTVCVAWGDARSREAVTHGFHWDRDYNRVISAWAALHHLRAHVAGA